MRYFFSLLSVMAILCFITNNTTAQGCIALRGTGGMCTLHQLQVPGTWALNVNNRYFKSFRHFSGKVEQKQRVDSGTQVINYSYTMDVTLTRYITNRWSVNMNVPLLSNTRTSLYEHANVARHSTKSFV